QILSPQLIEGPGGIPPGTFSFPGSAWERTDCEAPPRRTAADFAPLPKTEEQAEPARQCGPRLSLGPRRAGGACQTVRSQAEAGTETKSRRSLQDSAAQG